LFTLMIHLHVAQGHCAVAQVEKIPFLELRKFAHSAMWDDVG